MRKVRKLTIAGKQNAISRYCPCNGFCNTNTCNNSNDPYVNNLHQNNPQGTTLV